MSLRHELGLSRSELPADLELVIQGMNVSTDLVLRYCAGPHVAHTVLADSRPRETPQRPVTRVALDVDLEAMWNA